MKNKFSLFINLSAALIVAAWCLLFYRYTHNNRYWDLAMSEYTYNSVFKETLIDKKLGLLMELLIKESGPNSASKSVDNLFLISSFSRKSSAIILTAEAGDSSARHIYKGPTSGYKLSEAVAWLQRHPNLKSALQNSETEISFQLDLVSKRSQFMSEHFVSTGKELGASDFKPGVDGLIVYYNLMTHYILPSDFDLSLGTPGDRSHAAISNAVDSSAFKHMVFKRIRTHAYRYESGSWRYLNKDF